MCCHSGSTLFTLHTTVSHPVSTIQSSDNCFLLNNKSNKKNFFLLTVGLFRAGAEYPTILIYVHLIGVQFLILETRDVWSYFGDVSIFCNCTNPIPDLMKVDCELELSMSEMLNQAITMTRGQVMQPILSNFSNNFNVKKDLFVRKIVVWFSQPTH